MIEWKRQLPYAGQKHADTVYGPAEGIATITSGRPEVRRPSLAGLPWRP